jgi:hypothetical protein
MRRSDDGHRTGDEGRSAAFLAAGLIAAAVLGPTRDTWSGDAVLTLRPVAPAATVWMLSAPHTGKRTCEVPASTPIRFIKRASHGPHRYARVEVLEGACAGQQGYIPWATIEPEPQAN